MIWYANHVYDCLGTFLASSVSLSYLNVNKLLCIVAMNRFTVCDIEFYGLFVYN